MISMSEWYYVSIGYSGPNLESETPIIDLTNVVRSKSSGAISFRDTHPVCQYLHYTLFVVEVILI